MIRSCKLVCIASWLVLGAGCAAFKPLPEKHGVLIGQGESLALTKTRSRLMTLPEPAGKVAIAVYGFQDYTGQRKQSPASAFSTAVTQGAESILIRALIDSAWFSPLERVGIQNLLNERQLWSEKVNAGSLKNQRLKPLTPANVLIEGGIISYDYNIRTGGAGVRYLGIGGDDKYREDLLMINLRLVNAIDGAILHSIDVSKTVYSKSRNTGLFGFVEFDHIAEVEAGYAYNEPVQLAVVEAIESALIRLIAEGVRKGTWKVKHAKDVSHPAFVEVNPSAAVVLESVAEDVTRSPEKSLSASSVGDMPVKERMSEGAVTKNVDGGGGLRESPGALPHPEASGLTLGLVAEDVTPSPEKALPAISLDDMPVKGGMGEGAVTKDVGKSEELSESPAALPHPEASGLIGSANGEPIIKVNAFVSSAVVLPIDQEEPRRIVKDIQWRLFKLGIFKGRVSGVYGKSTQSAVKKFYQAHDDITESKVESEIYSAIDRVYNELIVVGL